MKLIKKHNAAKIYLERNPGSNAKFYVEIDSTQLPDAFQSQGMLKTLLTIGKALMTAPSLVKMQGL